MFVTDSVEDCRMHPRPDVNHGFGGGLPNGKYPYEVYWKVPRICDLLHFLGAE